jgi:Ribulose-5-phosphate 4-epimerase and related epimerases and aldolases
MDDLNQLKDEMIVAATRAYNRGIQTGSGGNFSARVPGKPYMLVKSSGGSFIDVTRDNLLVTDFDGNLIAGTGKPTREALLHGYIYKIAPRVNGIMHCHAPWSIGWAATKKPLDGVTLHTKLKFGCPIEVLDVKTPMVEARDFPLVDALFERLPALPAFLLVDHGIVAVGDTLINAEHNAELVEETAMVAFLKAFITTK